MNIIISLLFAFSFHAHLSPKMKDIPVLCYHNFFVEPNGKNTLYSVSREHFREQIRALHDSGYQTILPGELLAYLTQAAVLPPKPVMITFDDAHATQFSIAAPVLQEFGYKGVFFIMTVVIGKPGYLTTAQIKSLADSGHIIGCHTWDHPHLKGEVPIDLKRQLIAPRKQLEKITGKPVYYFAYPFGEWNDSTIMLLKEQGFKAAFQLNGKQDNIDSIYTLRRILVPGYLHNLDKLL